MIVCSELKFILELIYKLIYKKLNGIAIIMQTSYNLKNTKCKPVGLSCALTLPIVWSIFRDFCDSQTFRMPVRAFC